MTSVKGSFNPKGLATHGLRNAAPEGPQREWESIAYKVIRLWESTPVPPATSLKSHPDGKVQDRHGGRACHPSALEAEAGQVLIVQYQP